MSISEVYCTATQWGTKDSRVVKVPRKYAFIGNAVNLDGACFVIQAVHHEQDAFVLRADIVGSRKHPCQCGGSNADCAWCSGLGQVRQEVIVRHA